MKTILLVIILIPNYILAQANFDVRKVNWGMTIEEVRNSEEYLIPISENKNELVYDKIELNEEITCKLNYTFSNGKLIEVLYIVYGPQNNYSRVSLESNVPISYKINKVKFIFEALIEKKMTPFYMGWTIEGALLKKTDERLKDGKIDDETIDLIQKELDKFDGNGVNISYESMRNWASCNIKQFKKDDFLTGIINPGESYYNTYLWLRLSPSFEVKKELKKNDF